MVVHACNPSNGETATEEMQVPGQPGLPNETVVLKKKRTNEMIESQ